MHEASLIRSLLSQVERLLVENGGDRVARIVVEVGPLTGVEPLLVQDAFQQLAPARPTIAGADLQIEETPLDADCSTCQKSFEVQDFQFQCPACGSTSVRVTRGDEFRLRSIDVTSSEAETIQE